MRDDRIVGGVARASAGTRAPDFRPEARRVIVLVGGAVASVAAVLPPARL
jgi:hypothetical protein